MSADGLRFCLLGTLEVHDADGRLVDLGGAQPRAVLAALLAANGKVVPAADLIEVLWGEDPPPSAQGTLQSYISRLRRALEPDRRPRDAPRLLVSEPQGYRIVVDPDSLDVARFEALADVGRRAVAAGDAAGAARELRDAEAMWRGPALAEYRDTDFGRGLAIRLEERRLAVLEQRLEAELALGHAAEVAAEAAELVRREPLREAAWRTLALALYRAGRQGEALRALDDARRTLVEELGLEPGRALKDLEAAILAQDPSLDPAVAAVPAAATPPRGGDAPTGGPALVGRASEIGALHDVLTEARRGTRFVVVEGEPGIGKTRLLEALAATATATGALVVWGRTHETGAAPAYWPWLEALRGLVERRPEVTAWVEPLLNPSTDETDVGEAGPATFRLHEAVAAALDAAAREQPVVVLLDDLQWADPASLELLAFLTTRLVDAPLLVGVTLRTLEVGRSDAVTSALSSIARRAGSRRLTLRGLDETASAELLALAAGQPVPAAVVSAIHDRSGGNPFFAGELVRLLADEDVLDDAAVAARLPVPAGVRDVLRRRLDRLPEDTLDLLRSAAVLGRDLELPLLASAAGRTLDACLDALEPAVAHRLLVEVDGPPAATRFAHALVREVLVDDMTSLRRARLHLRAADALSVHTDDDTAELLAEHLWAAVPLGVGDRAAEALERAAEVAVRRAAFATAEDLLLRALSLRRAGPNTTDRARAELRTLMTLAGVARGLHGYRAILDLVDRGKELAEQLDDRELLLNLEWAEWAAADTACDFDRSTPIAERFLALAERADPDDPVSRMLGFGVWGIHCWHHGRITEAVRALDASQGAAAHLPMHEVLLGMVAEQRLLTEAFTVHVHGLAGDMDDPASGYQALIRSRDDRFARAMVSSFEATAASAAGDMERVGAVSREGLAADPDVAFSFWGSLNQMHLATALLAEGGAVGDAVALFEEGHARFLRAGPRTILGFFYATMSIGLTGAGDLDGGQEYLRRAQEELHARGERWPEPVILLAEAELLAAGHGTGDEVRSVLERARAIATEQGAHAVARRITVAADRLAGRGDAPPATST